MTEETTGKMPTRLFVIPYLSLIPMVSLFSLFSLVFRLLWLQDNYHQLAICADAEGRSPERET